MYRKTVVKVVLWLVAVLVSNLIFAQVESSNHTNKGSVVEDNQAHRLSQELEKARVACRDLSPENRRLMQASGYDVDSFCDGFNKLSLPAEPEPSAAIVVPRKPFEQKKNKPQGSIARELEPFGYNLFAGEPFSFEPNTNIPVTPDYLLGPGDTLQILLYGKTNDTLNLKIGRDGSVDFPELGPVNLSGLTFAEAKRMLLSRIAEQMIGVQANVGLGELRSIQVFLLGEAHRPGAYTVSSLSTITNALFVSGGVNAIASLRNIQLKRAGEVVTELDLYDLLLKGDTSADLRLQPGDVIYIPTVGTRVSIGGEVLRPAIYELKERTTVQQLLTLAGGFNTKAFPSSSRIRRIDESGFTTVIDIDLTRKEDRDQFLFSGDHLQIDSATDDRKKDIVTLVGHVYYPGDFRWEKGLRISDIIKDISQLRPDTDMNFALIRRELTPVGEVVPVFVNLRAALLNKDGEADHEFHPRDKLMVFSNKAGRQALLADFVQELKTQARSGEMAQVVTVSGTIRSPGQYPLTSGMRVTQLIAAAGGLKEAAYTLRGELLRYDFGNPEQATSDHLTVNLAAAFSDASLNTELRPHDVFSIRTIPEFNQSLRIILEGEVRFPGTYTFKRGEALSEVIERAGGLTDLAHARAAIFTREDLRRSEQKRLQELKQRLQAEIDTAELEAANRGISISSTDTDRFLRSVSDAKALGRLVIDLSGIIDGTVDDVKLKNGDRLFVPEFRQEVSVVGEVQLPTAHLFNGKLTVRDYLQLSGGLNDRADRKRIYVVKADGSVELPRGSGWFSRRKVRVEPGDTIVAPLNVNRGEARLVWRDASQIVYQLALGAAAINSF